MKIQEIISQYRRDFKAKYECEHCGNVEIKNGYDDEYFHTEVIPDMECTKCGKKAPSTYQPLTPKYPKDKVV